MNSLTGDVDLRKYIGKPYDKYNCLDLVKEFYKDFFGLDVKDYYEGKDTPDRREVGSLINTNRGDFVRVEGRPRLGDLVLIKLYGIECHIGVFVNPDLFLHSVRGAGSCLARISKFENLIVGYYRHREVPV